MGAAGSMTPVCRLPAGRLRLVPFSGSVAAVPCPPSASLRTGIGRRRQGGAGLRPTDSRYPPTSSSASRCWTSLGPSASLTVWLPLEGVAFSCAAVVRHARLTSLLAFSLIFPHLPVLASLCLPGAAILPPSVVRASWGLGRHVLVLSPRPCLATR